MTNQISATYEKIADDIIGIVTLLFIVMFIYISWIWGCGVWENTFREYDKQGVALFRCDVADQLSYNLKEEHEGHFELSFWCDLETGSCTDAQHWAKAKEMLRQELIRRKNRPDMFFAAGPIHWINGSGNIGIHFQKFCVASERSLRKGM